MPSTLPTDIHPQALLTSEEAADFLGVSNKTLESWRHKKIGPVHLVIGTRSVRYRYRDLLDWIDQQTQVNSTRRAG